jgi:YD repeat-containing protein
MVINNQNVVGVAVESSQVKSDATSITSYGIRQTEIETNVASPVYIPGAFNLVFNPSAEYSDDGYSGGATNKVRRRKPSEDANPFTAYSGQWAMRSRVTTATATTGINYTGGESDGLPVVAATTYYVTAYGLRGTVSRTDARARIDVNWYNDSEALISTSTGSNISLTTANTWYSVGGTFIAPANAVRATLSIVYTRSGGGNHSVNDVIWADALMMTKYSSNYFDGDTPWDGTFGYIWTGGVGASPSYKIGNIVDDVAADLLARYSTTSMRVTRLRWNAQEDLTAISALSVGKTVSIRYDGTTTTYRIVGIDGNIDTDRYMIDYYVQKV